MLTATASRYPATISEVVTQAPSRTRGQRRADLEAGEDVGERLRQADLDEQAPGPGAGRAGEVHHVRVERLEARDAADHDREEAQQKDQQQLRQEAEAEPDDEERRDRDLGHDLQEHDQGIDRPLEEARVGDQQRQRDADHDRQQIARHDFGGGDPGAVQHARPAARQIDQDLGGRRQQIRRQREQPGGELPQREQRHESADGVAMAPQPAARAALFFPGGHPVPPSLRWRQLGTGWQQAQPRPASPTAARSAAISAASATRLGSSALVWSRSAR